MRTYSLNFPLAPLFLRGLSPIPRCISRSSGGTKLCPCCWRNSESNSAPAPSFVGSVAKDEMAFMLVDDFFKKDGAMVGRARGFRIIALVDACGNGGGLRIENDKGLAEDDAFAGALTTNEGGLRGRRGAESGFWRSLAGGCADADFEGTILGRFTIGAIDPSGLCSASFAEVDGSGRS